MLIALVADSHLSPRAPEFVENWHGAARAVAEAEVDLTIHLGDITLDGQRWPDELSFAARCIAGWPSPMRCIPGNHDLGTGSGEAPFERALWQRYRELFGPDRWIIAADPWHLIGINAQLLGTGSVEEQEQWQWLEDHAVQPGCRRVALFLHRPLVPPDATEAARSGRYVPAAARERLLTGPLRHALQLVVSGHTHQFLDRVDDGRRHVWMPSTAFVLPDDLQARVGEKIVGFGLIRLDGPVAHFDLRRPDGIARHDISRLPVRLVFEKPPVSLA